MASKDRDEGAVRRAAKTAADFAIGGTALAADRAIETVDEAVDRAGSAFEKGRREARRLADDAKQAARSATPGSDDTDTRPYEERTRDELYALAADREIEGRSTMRKDELIAALRAER